MNKKSLLAVFPAHAVLILAAGLLFQGCSKGGCFLAGDYDDWVRNLDITTHDSTRAFGVSPYLLDSGWVDPKAFVHVSMNVDSAGEIPNEELFKKTPRILNFGLTTLYSVSAMRAWRDAGFFDSTDLFLQSALREGGPLYRSSFRHTVTLNLANPGKATYSFGGPGATGDFFSSATVQLDQYGMMPVRPAFLLHRFSGRVVVLEKITPDSGKFSYRFEVEYLPGQVSVFQGTVTYLGTTHSHSCGW